MKQKLKIAFAASEMVPYAKTGGLADVAGALPKFLAEEGHLVRLFVPKYRKVDEEKYDLKKSFELTFELGGRTDTAIIYTAEHAPGVTVYFIAKDEYFDRDELYMENGEDYKDNALRFAFFARAVLELCKNLDFQPDIFHCHDWQTGLIPTYLKTIYRNDPFYQHTGTIFTIHNLAYQGLFERDLINEIDLDWQVFTPDTLEYYGQISYIKGGIVFSELINTVSQKYSEEIQTEEYGCGLEGLLRHRGSDLCGVVNGIDYDEWNPETDPSIPANYSVRDVSGKAVCKSELIDENKLPQADVPLFGIISRLADQKGFDLIYDVIDDIMALDLQLVLLGTGDPKYHEMFEEVSKKYPEKAGINLGFDAKLAQRIYAGVDIFMMPSRYEPCGLGQLISLRYGTVPLVRRTGGLYDTIISHKDKGGNGFTFTEYDSGELLKTVKEAVRVYGSKKKWRQLVKTGMKADFSWHASARKYLTLYQQAIHKRRENQ